MNKEPLTQQELQGLAGKPVYCADIESYGIVKCESIGLWAGVPFLVGAWHHDGVAGTENQQDQESKDDLFPQLRDAPCLANSLDHFTSPLPFRQLPR